MIKRIIEYIHGFGKRQEDIQDEISALRNEIEELKDLVRGIWYDFGRVYRRLPNGFRRCFGDDRFFDFNGF